MQALPEKLLALTKVKKIFASFAEDGKPGKNLHDVYFQAYDSNVMLLLMNGVEVTCPRLTAAREALLRWTDYESDGFSSVRSTPVSAALSRNASAILTRIPLICLVAAGVSLRTSVPDPPRQALRSTDGLDCAERYSRGTARGIPAAV